jgi:hypothetical protein
MTRNVGMDRKGGGGIINRLNKSKAVTELKFARGPSGKQMVSKATYAGLNPAISQSEECETIHEEGGERSYM